MNSKKIKKIKTVLKRNLADHKGRKRIMESKYNSQQKRNQIIYHALKYLLMQIAYYLLSYSYNGIAIKGQQ